MTSDAPSRVSVRAGYALLIVLVLGFGALSVSVAQSSRSPREGRFGYRPDTVATARPTAVLELRIDRAYGGKGFALTVIDWEAEAGRTTVYATIEAAKVAAATASGIDNIEWSTE